MIRWSLVHQSNPLARNQTQVRHASARPLALRANWYWTGSRAAVFDSTPSTLPNHLLVTDPGGTINPLSFTSVCQQIKGSFLFKDGSLRLCSISVQLLLWLPIGWRQRLRQTNYKPMDRKCCVSMAVVIKYCPLVFFSSHFPLGPALHIMCHLFIYLFGSRTQIFLIMIPHKSALTIQPIHYCTGQRSFPL